MEPQLTIKAFAEWCEKQPADKNYNYCNCATCACGQYAALLGIGDEEWIDILLLSDLGGFWRTANNAARTTPHTFGALASRLRLSLNGQ